MHFADPHNREALDALREMKRLRVQLREEIAQNQEIMATAKEIIRQAEGFNRAVTSTAGDGVK